MHLDHLGIATDRGDELADLYGELFHARVAHEEEFDGLWVTFLEIDGAYFELLEPLETDSTIGRYLENHGPGLHHVALATTDIEGALETARENEVALIDDEPRPGAWGHEVAFLHPESTGGVLVEFVAH
ncbi:MAG: methylmalonyl-CoA epimerase [Halodesulfurarchaeum sp.]